MTLELCRQIIEKYPISNFKQFVQWEPSCSMRTDGRTDGQTDMTKLIVAFRNFVNPPKRRSLLVPVGYNRLYRHL